MLKQPFFYFSLGLSLILNALVWGLIIFKIPPSAAWVPLHYNSIFGIDWIGPWSSISYYPIVSLAIILFNFTLSYFLSYQKRTLSLILTSSALLVQIIVLTSLSTLILNYY